jgi:hypothetical protein
MSLGTLASNGKVMHPWMIGKWISGMCDMKTVGWKLKCSERNLCLCHFVHHKSHIYCSGNESGPVQWEDGNKLLELRYWCAVHGYFCTLHDAAVMCDALWLSGRYMFFMMQHCISMKANYPLSQLYALCYIKPFRVMTWHGISNNNCKIILIYSEFPIVT